MEADAGTNLMTFEEFEARVKDSYASAQKKLKRSKLLVEQDFRNFHQSAYRVFVKDESCLENVRQAVDHFAATTGLPEELNSTELDALMARVLEEMEIYCKHGHIEDITDPQEQADRFMTDFMETLAHEQPVMTARLMEVIMADSEGNYSLDFPDWLLNFSMLDLHDRTGRENQGNVTHGLLLTQSISYTDNMKKRSLPSSFDSRTHWSNCGEVIGRIHNQGTCGSCWAFGSLSAVDSRLCIATDGIFSGSQAQLSRGFATSFSKPGGGDGCQGGLSRYVFNFLATYGIPQVEIWGARHTSHTARAPSTSPPVTLRPAARPPVATALSRKPCMLIPSNWDWINSLRSTPWAIRIPRWCTSWPRKLS